MFILAVTGGLEVAVLYVHDLGEILTGEFTTKQEDATGRTLPGNGS
ncbi:MAG: hypothetical protein GY940_21895 [bacterium]|nr:hypothetical protein [bacterium]